MNSSDTGSNMLNENTLLTGQLLQIRDKIMAKRHAIPQSLQGEWNKLVERTNVFDARSTFYAARKGENFTKPQLFQGTSNDLSNLVSALKTFNQKITY